MIPIRKRVVIIGSRKHGREIPEFLVKRGRKVTIVDTTDALGEGIFHHLKCAFFFKVTEKRCDHDKWDYICRDNR